MKRSIKAAALSFAAVSACALSIDADAASQPTQAQLSAELQKVSAQTEALEQQVAQLKKQLRQQQAKKPVKHAKTNNTTTYRKKAATASQKKQPGLLEHMNGVTVTTSPILGLRSKYDASDLITNLPTMNEDLRLLSQRALLENIANAHGYTYAEKPFVILSGRVEGQIIDGGNFNGRASSDIDLDAAELDIEPIVSSWAAGFMSLMYDDSPPISGFRDRTSNSRIFLRRGFLTIGDLNKNPLYFTIGQMYAPFGRYSSALVTSPLTLTIGRTLTRAAVLGVEKDGFYAQGYLFRGDTNTNGGSYINQGGGNVGVKRTYSKGNYDIGAGVISNMADSSGMQETGYGNSNAFQGFGVSTGSETISHRVPALDAHASVGVGNWDIVGEYVGALREFSPLDLTYNNNGAAPKAMDAELIYNFPIKNRPSNIGLMFGESWQALGLNVPKQSYAIVFNTSIWKDTIEALEFRHDINYAQSDTAYGRNANGYSTDPVYLGPNHSRNLVSAQIGVYF